MAALTLILFVLLILTMLAAAVVSSVRVVQLQGLQRQLTPESTELAFGGAWWVWLLSTPYWMAGDERAARLHTGMRIGIMVQLASMVVLLAGADLWHW